VVLKSLDGVRCSSGTWPRVEVGPMLRNGAVTRKRRGRGRGRHGDHAQGRERPRSVDRVKSRMQEVLASLPAGLRIEPSMTRAR